MPLYALPACPLVPCPLLPYGVGLSSPFMFGASRAVSAPEGPTVPGAIPAPIIYLALLFAGIAIGFSYGYTDMPAAMRFMWKTVPLMGIP